MYQGGTLTMSTDENLTSGRTAARASLMLTSWVNPEAGSGPDAGGPQWRDLIRKVDAAVASGDAGAMLRAWQAASVGALLEREWESMVAVGDAALQIGRATGLRFAFGAKARQAYHVALFRAHRQRAIDGVLAAATGFTELGDADIVEQCLSIAERLSDNAPPPEVLKKIEALRARRSRS
jgi:hypothetical protein